MLLNIGVSILVIRAVEKGEIVKCAKFEVIRSSSLFTVLHRARQKYVEKNAFKVFWVYFRNVPTTIQFLSIVRLNYVLTMKILENNVKITCKSVYLRIKC